MTPVERVRGGGGVGWGRVNPCMKLSGLTSPSASLLKSRMCPTLKGSKCCKDCVAPSVIATECNLHLVHAESAS